jgi:hypothetical protein
MGGNLWESWGIWEENWRKTYTGTAPGFVNFMAAVVRWSARDGIQGNLESASFDETRRGRWARERQKTRKFDRLPGKERRGASRPEPA